MEILNENDGIFIERFLHAFKQLGGTCEGKIDYGHFKRSLQQENNRMETKEVLSIIEEERHLCEDKLDFFSLCSSLISTKAAFNKFSTENGRIYNATPRIDSGTFTRKKAASLLGERKLSSTQKATSQSLRGILINSGDDCLGHQYQLEIANSSDVEITMTALSSKGDALPSVPVEVLIFQDNRNKTFVYSSTHRNDEGHITTSCTLKKGKYILVPILLKWTSNCNFSSDSLNVETLVSENEESGISLSSAAEDALKVIFKAIDLDENGLLSKTEFDLFMRYTAGETAMEEWSTIEDNFTMQDGELTAEGFLELYRMVIKTDPSDIMNMFQKMGMNEILEWENAQPFKLLLKLNSSDSKLQALPVASFTDISDKTLRKVTVEQGTSSKLKGMNDLLLHTNRLPHRTTLLVQNKSHSKVAVRLDCTQSMNCQSHRKSLDYSVDVLPRNTAIVHHLFPEDLNKPWDVQCSEMLT